MCCNVILAALDSPDKLHRAGFITPHPAAWTHTHLKCKYAGNVRRFVQCVMFMTNCNVTNK